MGHIFKMFIKKFEPRYFKKFGEKNFNISNYATGKLSWKFFLWTCFSESPFNSWNFDISHSYTVKPKNWVIIFWKKKCPSTLKRHLWRMRSFREKLLIGLFFLPFILYMVKVWSLYLEKWLFSKKLR